MSPIRDSTNKTHVLKPVYPIDNAFILASFPEHQLRVTNVESKLCDGSVKQHSGYLDISDGRHLFFWYVSFLGYGALCSLLTRV